MTDSPVRRVGDEVDQVHAALRTMILHCVLEPGRRVTQAELSRLTGAGRTPLREALRMLQQEGLVRAESNKRITIASFDLDEIDCTYAYRISIESAALRISAPLMGEPDFEEMNEMLDEMAEAISRSDRDAFELPHRRFHQILASYVQPGARARIAIDADSSERVRRFLMQDDHHSLTRADAEHREIVEACRSRDGVKASRLLANHLARSAFYVTSQLEPTYDTVLTRTALRLVLGEDSTPPRIERATRGSEPREREPGVLIAAGD